MKLEWGKKVTCPACAMRFYDMMKVPVVCPYCGNSFEYGEIKINKKGEQGIDTVENEKIDFSDISFEIEEDPAPIADANVIIDEDQD